MTDTQRIKQLEFLLSTANKYLVKAIDGADIEACVFRASTFVKRVDKALTHHTKL